MSSDSPFTPEQEARIKQLIRAALKRPLRLEIAALGPFLINGETFAEAADPEIQRRLDDAATQAPPDPHEP